MPIAMWPSSGRDQPVEGGRIFLPYPYVMPNAEKFSHLFYWDSYFTIVGLAVDGQLELIRGMVKDFLHKLREFGLVLNRSCPSSLTRSQPPYLTSMIKGVLKSDFDLDWLREAFALAKAEYENVRLGKHNTPTGFCRYADPGDPDFGVGGRQ